MKINESKEALPISFITDFVSRGWAEIGVIKDQIIGMKDNFSGTTEAIEILQGLLDAYLVSVGQFELFLEKKKHVILNNTSITKEIKEDLTNRANITEATNIINDDDINEGFVDIENVNIIVEPKQGDKPEKFCKAKLGDRVDAEPTETELADIIDSEADKCQDGHCEKSEKIKLGEPVIKSPDTSNNFEYFVDFDDPVGDAPLDEELYSN